MTQRDEIGGSGVPGLVKTGAKYGPLGETTPLVWDGRLVLLTNTLPLAPGEAEEDYFHLQLRDAVEGRVLSTFGRGYSLASAFAWQDTLYVYGARSHSSGCHHDVSEFTSRDLVTWSGPRVVISGEPTEQIFNQSVCRAQDRFVMSYESNDPRWPAFTIKFAESQDLITWRKLPEFIYGTDRFTACPCLRYVDGWHYMMYVERRSPHWAFDTFITRSRDLREWEPSPRNPILAPGPGECCNASDPDVAEFEGRVLLYYSYGDQMTWGELTRAEYAGTLREFLAACYPPASLPALSRGGGAHRRRNLRTRRISSPRSISDGDSVNRPCQTARSENCMTQQDGIGGSGVPGLVKTGAKYGVLCEVTPLVWPFDCVQGGQGRLLLLVNVRPASAVNPADHHLELRDVAADRALCSFGRGYSLASAFAWGDTLYVYGARWQDHRWHDVSEFSSRDLVTWSEPRVVIAENPDEQLFNQSVCRAGDRFVMSYESNDPRWPAFTIKFAESQDLVTWRKLPQVVFGTDRYTACPCLRYVDGWYYMMYLERRTPHWAFETFMTRSRDLREWEPSPRNPILAPGHAECCNASDPDVAEFEGRVLLYYAYGDQMTWGEVTRAEYQGTLREFFAACYPGS
jgi:hypothetical protein